MSLIEAFPPGGSGGGGGNFDPTANIAFSGNNTHAGSEAFSSQLLMDKQTLSATGVFSASAGSFLFVTGSTGSQTASLPAAPTSGQVVFFRNAATVAWTLSGNGINIDGSASFSVSPGNAATLFYDGTAWWSFSTAAWLPQTYGGSIVFGSGASATFNSTAIFAGRIQEASQAASTSTFNVSGGGATYIASTFSPTGTQTINLPATPSSQEVNTICDEGLAAATNNITVSGNGKNIDGNPSITLAKNGAAVRLRYNGTAWFVVGAYNYP